MSDPQTCLCPQKSGPTVSCPHLCTLALEQSRRHLQNVPSQSLHVSQPTQDLRADPTVDIIPESSSFFQDLIILKRDFWYWACNFLHCIQLLTFFELFSKRLQNQSWRVRVQQRSLHLLPNFLCMFFKVALQGYFDSPTVCEETRCIPDILTRFALPPLNIPSAHRSFYEVSS